MAGAAVRLVLDSALNAGRAAPAAMKSRRLREVFLVDIRTIDITSPRRLGRQAWFSCATLARVAAAEVSDRTAWVPPQPVEAAPRCRQPRTQTASVGCRSSRQWARWSAAG